VWLENLATTLSTFENPGRPGLRTPSCPLASRFDGGEEAGDNRAFVGGKFDCVHGKILKEVNWSVDVVIIVLDKHLHK
jgi:hypothetical protein